MELAKFVSGVHDIRLLDGVVQRQECALEAGDGGRHLQSWMREAGVEYNGFTASMNC